MKTRRKQARRRRRSRIIEDYVDENENKDKQDT
jgi:hypothetical protein